jgi:hypothetical protein
MCYRFSYHLDMRIARACRRMEEMCRTCSPFLGPKSNTTSVEAASYPSRPTFLAVSCAAGTSVYTPRRGRNTPVSQAHRLSVKLAAMNDSAAYCMLSGRAALSVQRFPSGSFQGGERSSDAVEGGGR